MNYSQVLRIRSFRDLWLGQAISILGDGFYFVVFAFMVKKVTGSAAMVGVVGALETLPYLLLSPYAGVLADRIDRKRIMLNSDLACAAILTVFGIAVGLMHGRPPVWAMIATASAISCVRVFFMPAKNAAIPNLVQGDGLMMANALNAMTQSMLPMLSLAFSAMVMQGLYTRSPSTFFQAIIFVNAASFLGSAFFIARLPRILPDKLNHAHTHVLTDLQDGLRYVRSRRVLWVSLVLQMMLTITISPFFVAYVEANDVWFGGTPAALSWFECAFCVGMVISNSFVGKLNLRRPGMGYIWSLSVVGLCVVAMAFSPRFWPFCMWNFLCGIAIPFVDVPMMTWKQTAIPDALRGRYNSLHSMVQSGLSPIGLSLGGLLLSKVGLVWMFILMGVGMFLASLSGLISREFRTMRIDDPVEPIAHEKADVEPVPVGVG